MTSPIPDGASRAHEIDKGIAQRMRFLIQDDETLTLVRMQTQIDAVRLLAIMDCYAPAHAYELVLIADALDVPLLHLFQGDTA